MGRRYMLAALLLASTGIGSALADELPAETVAALERFYHHFDGEHWFRNDGWLDPAVNPCDWYGIECGNHEGQFGILGLSLQENRLTGPIDDTDIFDYVLVGVRLGGNRIHGSLAELPVWLRTLELADNDIDGNLPDWPIGHSPRLSNLDLARNRIEGQVPIYWSTQQINLVDLSGNRLSGPVEQALRIARQYLNIADNAFSGTLSNPDIGHLEPFGSGLHGGGLNLCWNELDLDDDVTRNLVAARHVGGENFVHCLGRTRTAIDPAIGGSWFDPQRSGEGLTVQLLANASSLMYYFGYDNQGRQHWLYGMGPAGEFSLHWLNVVATRGTFGQGQVGSGGWPILWPAAGWGPEWRVDRIDSDQLHLQRSYHDCSACPEPIIMPLILPASSDRLEYRQLTRLAGTRCDHLDANQTLSGAWYNPDRNGEGFVVEVLEDGRGLVYWFTYQPDDSRHQAWMMGDGDFDGQTLVIDHLVQPTGGRWGENFDPNSVVKEQWGNLVIEFFDDLNGHIHYDSLDEAYGSGDYPIERLSKVRLAECED